MALSEKAKGKQRAIDPESIAGPSSSSSHSQPIANIPQSLVIRFTEDVPDLEISVTEKDTIRDLKNTIRRERPELKNRRLRLIHSGRLLTNGTFIYLWLKKLDERQRRATSDEGKGNGGVDASVTPSTIATWLHCSVGREIEQNEEEEDGSQIQPARGFDRLASMGFSESDIASIRRQFHIQHDSFLNGDLGDDDNYDEHARALEEQWIESLDSSDNTSLSASSNSNSSAMQGILVGFFFPFLPFFVNSNKPGQPVFWEDGTEQPPTEPVSYYADGIARRVYDQHSLWDVEIPTRCIMKEAPMQAIGEVSCEIMIPHKLNLLLILSQLPSCLQYNMSHCLRTLRSQSRALRATTHARGLHTSLAIRGSKSALEKFPSPDSHVYKEKVDVDSYPKPSATHVRVPQSDTPGVPPGAFPTTAPYINYPPTDAPDYSGVQFSSTSSDPVAHPITRKVPRHQGGIGDSAAIRFAEAPGEMGARGGSFGGESLIDKQGVESGEGSLAERNPQPDAKDVAEKNSSMGIQEAWKARK
ncbi:hypothetical protein VNI00_007516 [Paramarasmius palmivorus]|uniref:Ubiquitin-like domain-containing protein n=1 Tax=Paramarasmius palmivorus TaxID=297713 RepID=A0AAW0D059_9AGAR